MKELEEYNKAHIALLNMFKEPTSQDYAISDCLMDEWSFQENHVFFGESIDNESMYSAELSNQHTNHNITKDGLYHMFLVDDDFGGDPYYMIFADKNRKQHD